MQTFGIDISHWQGNFNIAKAKEECGIQFVILKLGEGGNKDSKFDEYYRQAKALNIPVGCYYFGNALTVERAEWEAGMFITMLKDYEFEMPVYYDVEAKMLNSSDSLLKEIVMTFCNRIEEAGYFTGIYASESVFKRISDEKYTHWVAKWSSSAPSVNYAMWQFGGEVNKIRSNKICGVTVDQNYCNKDFPSIIKELGLNKCKKEVTEEKSKLDAVIELINNASKLLEEIKNGN